MRSIEQEKVASILAKKIKNPTVLSKVVRRVRERALATPPGDLIGSEDQLVTAFAVSRPTLRQAAALVAQEQLLRVTRGVGGGYFARRPESHAVAHIAAIYLQSRHTTLAEIIRAIEPIQVEIGVLVAENRDPDVIEKLRAFQARDSELEHEGGYREYLRSEREFSQLLGGACNNSVLALFLDTLNELCASLGPDEDVYRNRPDRVHTYWTRRHQLLAALIDGDAEMASMCARRCARLITTWMVEDVTEHEAGKPAQLDTLLAG